MENFIFCVLTFCFINRVLRVAVSGATLNVLLVKSVCIQSFSGPYFPAFWVNTERFSPNAVKCGPAKPRIRTLFMQSCLGEYLVNWKIFRDKKGNFYSIVFFIRDKLSKTLGQIVVKLKKLEAEKYERLKIRKLSNYWNIMTTKTTKT